MAKKRGRCAVTAVIDLMVNAEGQQLPPRLWGSVMVMQAAISCLLQQAPDCCSKPLTAAAISCLLQQYPACCSKPPTAAAISCLLQQAPDCCSKPPDCCSKPPDCCSKPPTAAASPRLLGSKQQSRIAHILRGLSSVSTLYAFNLSQPIII